MGYTMLEKILRVHTKDSLVRGERIKIKIDQTLTQDATGTMAYLEFLNMGKAKVETDLSVSYVDHNMLQNGFMNMDDHIFLQSVADKFGIVFSKAGNGICHQVHLERFAKPYATILGSDSHTPTSSAVGALAIGSGGLDVALAMAGKPFELVMPKICNVVLTGTLRNGVSAKDIILKVLSIATVKGGVNKVFEYSGDGVSQLNVYQRSTICNMGAELGATSSIFPSDEHTREFLALQEREQDYRELFADEGCFYDEVIRINLDDLSPLVAKPSQPDNVCTVEELSNIKVNQVLIGSCTNSSYYDFIKVASILKNKKIHKDVSLAIAPGSKQVLQMIADSGILSVFIASGARILESACGPCIGMGQSPCTNGVSLRTFNRNFYGRSGTNSADIYLVSPEVAAISALKGYIASPELEKLDSFDLPMSFPIDDSLLIYPTFKSEVIMGPNINPLPKFQPIDEHFIAKVLIKLSDNITTDHIMPAGSKVLPYRSNIEKISEFVFSSMDENFHLNAKKYENVIIVAGENYGQGSSREHAAIAPRYLNVKIVIAKSFARIHKKNLINFGILPLTGNISWDVFSSVKVNIDFARKTATLICNEEIHHFPCEDLTSEDWNIIKAGGVLNL